MSDDKRIKVKIDAMGNTTVEAVGFNGMGCTEATAPIERAVSGGALQGRDLKSEFHQIENTEDAHDHVTF